MSSKGYNDSGANDFFIIFTVVVVFIFAILIRENFHLISGVWRWLRIVEMGMFYWIPDWLPFYGKLEIKQAFHWLLEIEPRNLAPETLYEFDHYYAKWFSWIPGMLLIYLGIRKSRHGSDITVDHDMESILYKVAPLYPFLSEFLENHPEEKELTYKPGKPDSARYSAALSPGEFSLMNPPLGLQEQAKRKVSYRKSIWDGNDDFDMDLAERALSAQIGSTFSGVSNLKPVERRLFDFLIPKMKIDEDDFIELSNLFLPSILGIKSKIKFDINNLSENELVLYKVMQGQFEKRLKTKKFKPSEFMNEKTIHAFSMDKSLEKYFKAVLAERIMMKHAFVRVGLMSLLEQARKGGVIACVEFSWIKGEDRILWYALESVGRKVSFVESAGIFAHWLIEKQLGRSLPHPEVHEAVDGLMKALKIGVEDD